LNKQAVNQYEKRARRRLERHPRWVATLRRPSGSSSNRMSNKEPVWRTSSIQVQYVALLCEEPFAFSAPFSIHNSRNMASINSPAYVDYPGYIYAVLVAQGGIMGYAKKGSIASLL
jgi:hypothetical protein